MPVLVFAAIALRVPAISPTATPSEMTEIEMREREAQTIEMQRTYELINSYIGNK